MTTVLVLLRSLAGFRQVYLQCSATRCISAAHHQRSGPRAHALPFQISLDPDLIAAKDRSSKSSNSKDVSSYKRSHCVDVSGDVENVPMFGRDRSECLNAAVVHWHDQNRSQGSQYGQEESGNNEVVPDRSCNLPHIQVCCCFLTNGPDRSLSQHFRSHKDTHDTASQTVNLKNSSKDAENESTVVDKQIEAKDITVTKADKRSSSTRGQSKMDGKCSSSTEDPNTMDGQSSRDYNKLKHKKVPSGTRSPIITNDLIVEVI